MCTCTYAIQTQRTIFTIRCVSCKVLVTGCELDWLFVILRVHVTRNSSNEWRFLCFFNYKKTTTTKQPTKQ